MRNIGPRNRYGTISLDDAMVDAGVTWGGRAHSAAVDALATAELVKAVAAIRAGREQELAALVAATEATAC